MAEVIKECCGKPESQCSCNKPADKTPITDEEIEQVVSEFCSHLEGHRQALREIAEYYLEKGREEALRLVCPNFTGVIGNKILRGQGIKYAAFIDLWQKVERQALKEGK